MHVLGLSILVGMSSSSFAEITMNSTTAESQGSISWTSEDANQFLNDGGDDLDEPSPLGSTTVTTSIRSTNGVAVQAPEKKNPNFRHKVLW